MQHVDAFSSAVNVMQIMIIDENPFEINLSLGQNNDHKIRELSDSLEITEDRLYEMRNGIIYRKQKDDLFYAPADIETNVIRKYHDEMEHLETEKTCEAILTNYWFPHLRAKVNSHISNCLKCITFSPPMGNVEGHLHPIRKGKTSFETYHIDHYGPIDKRHFAKQYILVVVDAFTKFTKLYSTKTTETKEVIAYVTDHFQNYSRPVTIISDRASSFTSVEFEDFVRDNNIQHIKIATGSPKANGQVERVNRVLGPMLAKLSDNPSGKFWYKVVGDVEFALNNTLHKSSFETPSKLLFGINQRGTLIDVLGEYLQQSQDKKSPRDLVSLRTKAKESMIKAQECNKNYFDEKRNESTNYKIGDYVMVRNFDSIPGAPKKLIPRYKGPYEVFKELRNDPYILMTLRIFSLLRDRILERGRHVT